MSGLTEIVIAISLSIGSGVLCIKNIKEVKACFGCFSCTQETASDREEELKALELNINKTIQALQEMKQITPRLREKPATPRSTAIS